MQFNYLKAGIAALGLLCVTFLMGTSHLETSVGMPVLTAIVMWALTNGINNFKGKDPEPLLKPKPKPEDDEEDPTEP